MAITEQELREAVARGDVRWSAGLQDRQAVGQLTGAERWDSCEVGGVGYVWYRKGHKFYVQCLDTGRVACVHVPFGAGLVAALDVGVGPVVPEDPRKTADLHHRIGESARVAEVYTGTEFKGPPEVHGDDPWKEVKEGLARQEQLHLEIKAAQQESLNILRGLDELRTGLRDKAEQMVTDDFHGKKEPTAEQVGTVADRLLRTNRAAYEEDVKKIQDEILAANRAAYEEELRVCKELAESDQYGPGKPGACHSGVCGKCTWCRLRDRVFALQGALSLRVESQGVTWIPEPHPLVREAIEKYRIKEQGHKIPGEYSFKESRRNPLVPLVLSPLRVDEPRTYTKTFLMQVVDPHTIRPNPVLGDRKLPKLFEHYHEYDSKTGDVKYDLKALCVSIEFKVDGADRPYAEAKYSTNVPRVVGVDNGNQDGPTERSRGAGR